MSTITRIDYTLADGNVWAYDVEGYDMNDSLNHLAEMIDEALADEFPLALITVRRENAGGAVREVVAETDDDDGIADDATIERIAAIADAVWCGDGWYVAAQ